MGKTTKSSTAKTETKSETPVAAATQVAASAAATSTPVVKAKKEKVEKVEKKTEEKAVTEDKPVKAAKASKAKVESVVTQTSTSTSTSTEAVVEESVETPLTEKSLEFIAKLGQISVLMSSLKTEFRTLEKAWTKELKASQKTNNKRKKRSGNRAPSGFVKPTRISSELATFLEKPEGTEMARTAVTRDINTYIRTNSLQDKSNGRKINPDAKLASLLKLQSTDELTYFNLQKFMSPHFAKNVKAGDAVVAAVAL